MQVQKACDRAVVHHRLQAETDLVMVVRRGHNEHGDHLPLMAPIKPINKAGHGIQKIHHPHLQLLECLESHVDV